MELTQTPHQARQPQGILCSKEKHGKISQEIKELLDKGAIVEAPLSAGSYISQIFLVEKEGGGQRPVVNLKGLNSFVKMEHFKMEGLHIFARFNPARGLDDQAGLEGRLPSSPNSQREPTSPPIQMGAENIPVCVSTIWADLSPMGLHKNNETCGREAETDGYTSDHILGQYTNYAPLEGGDGTDYSPSMLGARSPGLDG